MKVLVVGAGMAGLTYSILAARRGNDVTVCERNTRVGRKVAMSGNGKCNIGNMHISASAYNAPVFVQKILDVVPVEKYLDFLRSAGIYTYADESGRLYPVTDSASSVVDVLRFEAARLGVKILTDTEIVKIDVQGKFVAETRDGQKVYRDKVIVACGSKSQADETNLAPLVGRQYLTAMSPSLTPVRVKNMNGTLNGVRNRAKVTLFADGTKVAEEHGEVQFKDYGLSGVCVFNLSAFIARDIVRGEKHEYKFVVDVVPDIEESDLTKIIAKNIACGHEDPLVGLVKNRVADYVKKQQKTASDDLAKTYAHMVKNLTFIFDKLLDYSLSQVTAGGVNLAFVDDETLCLPNGISVLGEALDVDGQCGGFNLQFAASSALYLFDGKL